MHAIPLSALVLLTAPAALAQAPSDAGRRGAPDDLRLARQMGEEVRRLADDVAADLGRTWGGRYLRADVREFGQALEEYRRDRRSGASPSEARRQYAGLRESWSGLRDQLGRPGSTSANIRRDVERIDALEADLERSLGLVPPPDQPAPPPGAPPEWVAMTGLARALAERADALALAIEAEFSADTRRAGLVADSQSLAREADAWGRALARDTDLRIARRTYRTVDSVADRVERVVAQRAMPPRVASAWVGFARVEALVEGGLGFEATRPVIIEDSRPVPLPPPPPVLGLADALVNQTRDFVRVFGPTAKGVPEGEWMLIDARRLLAAAQAFREVAARGGDPGSLGRSYRDVDAIWNRLARRVNRIAEGRTGPNIQQVALIGETSEQIHGTLGLPGYVPLIRVR